MCLLCVCVWGGSLCFVLFGCIVGVGVVLYVFLCGLFDVFFMYCLLIVARFVCAYVCVVVLVVVCVCVACLLFCKKRRVGLLSGCSLYGGCVCCLCVVCVLFVRLFDVMGCVVCCLFRF